MEQEMSRTLAAPDEVVQPTQLLYPSTVKVAPTGQDVFVVNGSNQQILKINLTTMIYHLVPWSPKRMTISAWCAWMSQQVTCCW